MGAGGSTYLQIKFRKTVQAKVAKYAPPHVVDVATGKVKELRTRVGSAVSEGRSAMTARETELRARVSGRTAKRSGSSRPEPPSR